MKPHRMANICAALAVACVAVGWLCFRFGDAVWWTLPVLFGPRWIWLFPLAGFLPLVRVAPRRGVPLAVAATLVVVFSILDFRLGLGRLAAPSHRQQLRVMSVNDEGGGAPGQPERLLDEIGRVDPDIVVIPECGPVLRAALEKWGHTLTFRAAVNTELCLLTRGKIESWSERDPLDAWKQYGSAAIIRVELDFPEGPIRLGMVHLATPRSALEDFRSLHSIPTLGPATEREINERADESAHALAWIDQGATRPTIIAGDFNIPVESAIYRMYWSEFRNAFSETGFGTGYSKHTSLWGIRIDHILMSPDIRPLRSYVGRDVGSDHLPMVADIALPVQAIARP